MVGPANGVIEAIAAVPLAGSQSPTTPISSVAVRLATPLF